MPAPPVSDFKRPWIALRCSASALFRFSMSGIITLWIMARICAGESTLLSISLASLRAESVAAWLPVDPDITLAYSVAAVRRAPSSAFTSGSPVA